ncbi:MULTISPECIES: hypothetical protein [unclassified Mesorhizobium]|nr:MULTISPECIES: hypothetical protein [unclassified Mesorhizobium]
MIQHTENAVAKRPRFLGPAQGWRIKSGRAAAPAPRSERAECGGGNSFG